MFSAQVVALSLLFCSRLLLLGYGLFRRRRFFGGSRLRLCRRRARWLGYVLLGLGGRRLRRARCWRGRYGRGLSGLFRSSLFRSNLFRSNLFRGGLFCSGLGSGSGSGFVVKLGNGALPMLLRPAIRTPFALPNLVSTFFNLALIVMRHSLFPHRVFSRLQFSQKRQRYQPWHRSELRRVAPAFALSKPCLKKAPALPRTRRNRSRWCFGWAKTRCKAVGAPGAVDGRGVVTSNHNGYRDNYAHRAEPTIPFFASSPAAEGRRPGQAGLRRARHASLEADDPSAGIRCACADPRAPPSLFLAAFTCCIVGEGRRRGRG